MREQGPRLAVFISPHGFGHAARASAVMEALHRKAGATFEVFASTPRWFLDEAVEGLYAYHRVETDVGLRQSSALEFDLDATVQALQRLVPFDDAWVDELARTVEGAGCRAVLCDIAPLGIAVAERVGLPSVLVENFIWPWLYGPLAKRAPALASVSRELAEWFGRVSLHVQTEPLCEPDPGTDLTVSPISRTPRRSRDEVRRDLGLSPGGAVVVVTMGGVPQPLPFLRELAGMESVTFLVTGTPESGVEGNLHLYANDTRIYMPDFVRAADAVVAKLGYSTVAEVWREGRPLAFVSRSDFRETPPLRAWVTERIPGFEIPGEEFGDGGWISRIPELLGNPARQVTRKGGADAVAQVVLDVVRDPQLEVQRKR